MPKFVFKFLAANGEARFGDPADALAEYKGFKKYKETPDPDVYAMGLDATPGFAGEELLIEITWQAKTQEEAKSALGRALVTVRPRAKYRDIGSEEMLVKPRTKKR